MAQARTANIVSFDEARRARVRNAGEERAEREERDQVEELDPRERRRRERAKARAERMYSKQFADAASAPAPEDGAPRPALYETKMGSSHRKSARMQRSSSAGAATSKLNPAGWLGAIPITARAMKIATAALCAVLVCTSLYIPAKQFYQAQREHDRLAAEYSVIEKRNETLDVQNDILASDAGMEDAVRQKYGYVKSGEETAVVTGLSDSATDTSRGSENIEANVLSSSIKPAEEWYTPFLDTFFGVE